MSFISYPTGGGAAAAASPSQSSRQALTSSGAVRIIGGSHIVHVAPLGAMTLDLAATDPADLVLPMQAQGRYLLDEIVFHDLRGSPGNVAVTIRTLDAARGGGVLLVDQQPLASLAARHGLIRIPPPEVAIWEAPHLYVTLTGAGSGSVLIRALGTVVVPEDPEHPMSDVRRIG